MQITIGKNMETENKETQNNRKYKAANRVYVIGCIAIFIVFAYILLDFFIIPKSYDEEPTEIIEFVEKTPENTSAAATASPECTEMLENTESPESTEALENTEAPESTVAPEKTSENAETTDTPEATSAPTVSATKTPEKTTTPTPTPTATPTPAPSNICTDTEYYDGETHIVLTTYREYSTQIYVADVTLTNISDFKTAFAKGKYGRNITQTTSDMAEDNNAILAINGDYYGKRENGYVVRNGVVYRKTASKSSERNTYSDLALLQSGEFKFYDESETEFSEIAADLPWQVFCFGPSLLEDGEITVSKNYDVAQSMESNPRTAVAEIEPGHYLFVVSDGRTDDSDGLSLYEMAEFLKKLGAKNAYNLDGGGSSTMYFNGKVVNNPVNSGKISERKVSDIVYIGNKLG